MESKIETLFRIVGIPVSVFNRLKRGHGDCEFDCTVKILAEQEKAIAFAIALGQVAIGHEKFKNVSGRHFLDTRQDFNFVTQTWGVPTYQFEFDGWGNGEEVVDLIQDTITYLETSNEKPQSDFITH